MGFELRITEVLFENSTIANSDGDYSTWLEIRNPGPGAVSLNDYFLSNDLNYPKRWRLPSAELAAGDYVVIWFSGKNKIDLNGDIHIENKWDSNWKTLVLFDSDRNLTIDTISLQNFPKANFSIGRFPELGNEWVIYSPSSISKGSKNPFPGKWQNISSKSSFAPRDNSPNSVLVFRDQVWILSGEIRDELGIWTGVTDVWKSSDLVEWELLNPAAPYRHISSFAVFNDQMWAFDESAYSSVDGITWEKKTTGLPFKALRTRITNFNGKLINITEKTVYESSDGVNWEKILDEVPFEQRDLFHLVVFNNKLWALGGMNNYGTEFIVAYNDVWSSEDGISWTKATDAADWQGRLWPSVITYDNRLWLMGGWDPTKDETFLSNYGNLNDVWSTSDGVTWTEMKDKSIWPNRHAMYSCIFDDYLCLVGGFGGGGIARMYNDVWKLNLKEITHVDLDTTAKVYGHMPFLIAESAQDQPLKYYSFDSTIVEADASAELTITGSGTVKLFVNKDGDQYSYPIDTIAEITIKKRDLHVKAGNYVKKFGEPVPSFSIVYEGFAYNEDVRDLGTEPTIHVDADNYSPLGSYELKVTAWQENNYRLLVENGILTIVNSERDILLFPNPSSDGVLNIVIPHAQSTGYLEIMDTSGRIVKGLQLISNSNRYIVNLDGLGKGLYYYRITNSHLLSETSLLQNRHGVTNESRGKFILK